MASLHFVMSWIGLTASFKSHASCVCFFCRMVLMSMKHATMENQFFITRVTTLPSPSCCCIMALHGTVCKILTTEMNLFALFLMKIWMSHTFACETNWGTTCLFFHMMIENKNSTTTSANNNFQMSHSRFCFGHCTTSTSTLCARQNITTHSHACTSVHFDCDWAVTKCNLHLLFFRCGLNTSLINSSINYQSPHFGGCHASNWHRSWRNQWKQLSALFAWHPLRATWCGCAAEASSGLTAMSRWIWFEQAIGNPGLFIAWTNAVPVRMPWLPCTFPQSHGHPQLHQCQWWHTR